MTDTQTKADVEKEFRSDLLALLDKYGATLTWEDRYSGYAECGRDIHIIIEIPSIWKEGELVREWTEVDLGGIVSAET